MERIKDWDHPQAFVELLSFFGKLLLNQTLLQIYRFLKNYEGLSPREVTSQSAVKITTLRIIPAFYCNWILRTHHHNSSYRLSVWENCGHYFHHISVPTTFFYHTLCHSTCSDAVFWWVACNVGEPQPLRWKYSIISMDVRFQSQTVHSQSNSPVLPIINFFFQWYSFDVILTCQIH